MTNLTVIERDGILVVDSRLVAQRLGIEHHTLLKTIDKYLARLEAKSPVRFEVDVVKRPQGGGSPTRYALLNERQATQLMTYSRNTEPVLDCKDALVDAFERAKQIVKQGVSAQNPETERIKLELELIRAKQHYQDTGHAIALSTSPAMLQWLRGETPPPPKIEYRERFIDPVTRQEIGSTNGRSLTQLIADAGLNPKSTRERNRVKKILKCHGFDYERMQHWVSASYLRKYPVLEDEIYQQVLNVVLAEVARDEARPNLFVYSLDRAALTSGNASNHLKGE